MNNEWIEINFLMRTIKNIESNNTRHDPNRNNTNY
jgi:hypothetical protein